MIVLRDWLRTQADEYRKGEERPHDRSRGA
jgi:hypothetical protein